MSDAARPADPNPEGPIVLFDGVCNLCAGAVRFIIRRDRRGRFRFAALQSDAGRRILAATGVETPGPGEPLPEAEEPPASLILVADGRTHARSGAALRIAAGLDAGWPLLAVFLVVPAPLRDWAYRFVARNRYRWFGKETACELPRNEESWRFIDTAGPVP
ncbi:thiol-disulfide oxidoreductase DCC family protein [Candidatus Palauibacter irciniicola]|uniref:thiol-disulfide oxidoreductase DCC family protein n=1 Tax=Candidatus Palauibacter irciniicola TaxID=3056733 RepID=UPI003B02CFB9